jgi:hypothetical protein
VRKKGCFFMCLKNMCMHTRTSSCVLKNMCMHTRTQHTLHLCSHLDGGFPVRVNFVPAHPFVNR